MDFSSARRVAIAKADQAPDSTLDGAADLFQAAKEVSVVDDIPGLVVLRSVAMLANDGGEAMLCGVASPSDIDRAMRYGVNYPLGPLEWAERIGFNRILRTLEAMHAAYGDDRCALLLTRIGIIFRK